MKNKILVFTTLFTLLFAISCKKTEVKSDIDVLGLKGQVKSISIYDDNGLREIHRYNKIGFEVEKEDFFNGYLKVKYLRNNKNNIIEEISEGKDAEGFNINFVSQYFYNEQDKLTKKTLLVDNTIKEINEFTYDNNGNLITENIKHLDDSINDFYTFYKYDTNGNVIEIEKKSNISEKPFSKTIFKYDEDNNKVFECDLDNNGKQDISKYYSYNSDGNLIELKNQHKAKVTFVVKYIYEAKKILEEKTIYKDGSTNSLKFEYDSIGNWIKKGDLRREIEYYSENEKDIRDELHNPNINKSSELNYEINKPTYAELRGTIIQGSEKTVKDYLGEPDFEMNGVEYSEDILKYKLSVGMFDKVFEYLIWSYKSADDSGKEILVIFKAKSIGFDHYGTKVEKVIYAHDVNHPSDIFN